MSDYHPWVNQLQGDPMTVPGHLSELAMGARIGMDIIGPDVASMVANEVTQHGYVHPDQHMNYLIDLQSRGMHQRQQQEAIQAYMYSRPGSLPPAIQRESIVVTTNVARESALPRQLEMFGKKLEILVEPVQPRQLEMFKDEDFLPKVKEPANKWTDLTLDDDPVEEDLEARLTSFTLDDEDEVGNASVSSQATEAVIYETIRRSGDKVRPRDPCPCGSGKKYKKCHGLGF